MWFFLYNINFLSLKIAFQNFNISVVILYHNHNTNNSFNMLIKAIIFLVFFFIYYIDVSKIIIQWYKNVLYSINFYEKCYT